MNPLSDQPSTLVHTLMLTLRDRHSRQRPSQAAAGLPSHSYVASWLAYAAAESDEG